MPKKNEKRSARVVYEMTRRSLVFLFALFVSCAKIADAGILPTLPNPFEGARGWYIPNLLPDFEKISEFWNDVPRQASNFLNKIVPRPIKNLLNFDPVPDWVPDPKGFEENENKTNTSNNDVDMTAAGSEHRSLDVNDEDIEDKIDELNNYEEKGNLHGIGRDVIRSLTDQFSNITTGLDTDTNFFNGVLNGFKDKVKAIFPGTQWCGDGNVARTKKHLGFFYKTDSCCREHDNCADYIEKDQEKYGLYNRGLFTRSNCECDDKFYKCLKEANDMISSQIGMAYFSVLGPQCFKKEYPVVDCRIRFGITNRCLDYEVDTNATEKVYQWFDNPEY